MTGSSDTGYVLGSDAAELERLDLQGRVLAPATRTILEAAGLRSGIRVLDLGSGAGDMAFVAAELVGSTGEVVGVDQSAESVARATVRAGERGVSNVRFVVGDIHDKAPDGPFDAIIGRLVLMYVPDPAAVLRTQAASLRAPGVVAPIEFDLHSARSLPSTPLVARSGDLLGVARRGNTVVPAVGTARFTGATGTRRRDWLDRSDAPAVDPNRAPHARARRATARISVDLGSRGWGGPCLRAARPGSAAVTRAPAATARTARG